MGQGFLLRKDDYPNGIQTSGDVERLAALLNPYLTAVNDLAGDTGVSLSGNVSCEVQAATLSHGVASGFSLKKLPAAKGCLVLGCDSGIPIGLALNAVQTTVAGALPRVAVTVWFNDPAVTNAKCSLLFLPEGQLAKKTLSFLSPLLSSAGCRARYTSTIALTLASGVFTVLNLASQEYDSDNAVTTGAAWKFTVPATKGGLYHVSASASIESPPVAAQQVISVFVNGAEKARGGHGQQAGSLRAGQTVSAGVFVNAGDTIDVRYFHDSGGAQATEAGSAVAWVSIYRALGY